MKASRGSSPISVKRYGFERSDKGFDLVGIPNTPQSFSPSHKNLENANSQLLKRLSSYAKESPLYKTLKEFGRIIKSLFMLTYLDDMEFRQRIEKQLNKIEFANRFSKAIIGDNKQEFEVGTKEEQEIIAACNILIQNCVNLWN